MWARLKSSLRKSELLDADGAPSQEAPSSQTSVRVAVRARPLVAKERAAGAKACIVTEEVRKQVTVGQDRTFTFDHVFGSVAQQAHVYEHCVQQLVEGCFAGYNATVLAYGQTGSGKTHTMGTSGNAAAAEEEHHGITPRVIRQLFTGIQSREHKWQCTVRIQFLEIHNEEVKDLLHPDILSKNFAIRETSEGQIFVAGAADEAAESGQEAIRLLEVGSLSRATGSTLMNEQSSRSHAIFTLSLDQSPLPGHPGEAMTAKLHLVDLAGSERAKKTGAAGKQLKESVGINAGLLALGNVISALGDPKKRPTHVPYRDSKLTRLLQDSLGGNSRTLMIACVTLADTYLEESLNTLKYANRARNIKNQPKVNRGRAGGHAGYQEDLQSLQLQLVQRQLAEPEMALSPALLFGDLTSWAADESLMHLLKQVASGQVPAEELKVATAGDSALRQQLRQAQEAGMQQQAEVDRLADQLESQHSLNTQLRQQASAVLSALDELQARKEVSDSGRGRLRSILAGHHPAPAVATPAAMSHAIHEEVQLVPSVRQSSRLPGGVKGVQRGSLSWLGSRGASAQRQDMQAQISDLEGELRGRTQQLSQCQQDLTEAQEDLARDEVIFAGKLKELREMQSIAQQLQAQLGKQAAKHSAEVDELLLELSKQNAAAQAAHTTGHSEQAETDGQAGGANRLNLEVNPGKPAKPEVTAGRSPTPPRLTTPNSPVRRPNRGSSGDWGGDLSTAEGLAGLGQAEEAGDQVLIGGIPTRPSTASTAGRSNLDVDSPAGSITEALLKAASNPMQAELLSEHRRIQKGRKELQFQAVRESRHYHEHKQSLDRQLRDCVYNIRNKEDLIAALHQNESQAKQLSQQYLERLHQLEGQMVVKEAELRRLKAELEAIDSDRARSEEERKKMRAVFEEKVEQARKQLAQLQKQLKEGDAAKRAQGRSKDRMKALEGELARMHHLHTSLHHKLKNSAETFEKESQAREAEKAALRKTGEAHRRKVKQLEQELAGQRSIAKRKTDEATVLQKRIHHLALESRSGRDKAQAYASGLSPGMKPPSPGGSSVGVLKTPGSNRLKAPAGAVLGDVSMTPGDPVTTPVEMRAMQLGPAFGDDVTPSRAQGAENRGSDAQHRQTPLSHQKKKEGGSLGASRLQISNLQVAVDKQIKHLQDKAQAEEHLRHLQQRKEALQHERDAKQQQRSQLDLQIMRMTQARRASELSSDAESQSGAASQGGAERGLQGGTSGEQEEVLQNQAAALDDALDTCDTQLRYLDKSMQERQQSGADAAAEAAAAADLLIQHASTVRGKEAQSIVQQLITRVVAQQETQRSAQAQAAELESVVAERTQNIATAETTLKLKELEFERRATALEAEHAAKMASMLQQMKLLQDSNARTEPQAEARQALAAQQSSGVPSAELGAAEPSLPMHQGMQMAERDAAVVSHGELEGGPQQAAELRQQLELYKEEREQLSKDVCFYKQSCKDLKQRLRTETSLRSSSGTVLFEMSNQSETSRPQRQVSPGKQNRFPGHDRRQRVVDMAVEGFSAFRQPIASRSKP